MEILRKKRYVALGGLLIAFIGLFLPFFKIEVLWVKETITLIKYWEGIVTLVLLIAITLFIFRDFIEKYIPSVQKTPFGGFISKLNPKLVLVPIILIVLLILYLTIHSNKELSMYKEYIKFGAGFYMIWIGAVLLVAHVFLYKPDAVAAAAVTSAAPAEPVQPVAPVAPAVEASPVVSPEPVPAQPEAPVQPVAEPMPAQPEAPAQPATKFCSQCGSQVDINATVCPVCGKVF